MKKKLWAFALALLLAANLAPLPARAGEAQASLTDGGVTAEGCEAKEKLEVSEGTRAEEILAAIREKYPGSAPELLYYKELRFTDTETGEPCAPLVSLTFPVPEGYDGAANPRVLACLNGGTSVLEVSARQEGAYLTVSRIKGATALIAADIPIPLTGVQLEEELQVNRGQEAAVKVRPVPQTATEAYALDWESSDPAVAAVDEKTGVLMGVGTGQCTVTARVRDRADIPAVSCTVTVVEGIHELEAGIPQVLRETRQYMLSVDKKPTVGSEWFALGLARGGMDPEEKYFKTYYQNLADYLAANEGVLTGSVKYTEYSKTILALTAMGRDARNVSGYNLFRPLADMEKVTAQGINGPIWALIALNSHPDYTIPKVSGVKEQTTERGLIAYILDHETPESGWSLNGDRNSGSPDPDITGMAFQAFGPYYGKAGYEDVTAAVDRALAALGRMQSKDGGFSTWGSESSESCVQMITGLCALGIDPAQDARFIKGGSWLVERLIDYHISGSGFMHVLPGMDNNGGAEAGKVDGMATEQGYYALVAYQRLLAGENALYDMSDVTLTVGGAGKVPAASGQAKDPDKTAKAKDQKSDQKSKQSAKQTTGKKTAESTDKKTSAGAGTGSAGGTAGGAAGTGAKRLGTSAGTTAAKTLTSARTTGKTLQKKAAAKSSGKQEEAGAGGWSFTGSAFDPAEDSGADLQTVAMEESAVPTGNRSLSVPLVAGILSGGIALGAALGVGGFLGGRELLRRRRAGKTPEA